jgi:coiled-coil domain-containing protein 12
MSDRKARLAALAAKAGRIKSDSSEAPAETAIEQQQPAEVVKDSAVVERASKRSRSEATDEDETRPNALEVALAKARTDSATAADSSDRLAAAAPRKINWDLKRDIQPKLDKLERKTQKAIVELLKARLEQQAEID